MQAGDVITLKGKSNKGKSHIKENGNQWLVLNSPQPVMCFSGRNGFHTMPLDGPTFQARWVREHNDRDFEVQT